MAVMVVVVAMLVVVIVVAVVMIVMVIIVLVRRMIMPGVVSVIFMRMAMAAAGIGAALGIERRLDLDHARAETFHHGLDHMVAADPQALSHDLRRQMTVAEMPADPDQMLRIVAADFGQRLRRRHHLDQPAVFQNQRVAAAQRHRVFKVEQEFQPARTGHRHPPPMAVVEAKHDGIGRRLIPAVMRQHARGPDHARTVPPPVIARRPFPA